VVVWVSLALFGMSGCTSGREDSASPGLPPEDTSGWVQDTGTFPIDTSDSGGGDETPPHWLTLRQAGSWTLAGDLDDPSSMTGTLEVTELFDGEEEEPACTQDWALVGARAEEGCDACFTFEVEHTLLTSDGECRTPELPEDAEVRALGWEQAADTVWWDWYDSGVWVPLWATTDGKVPGDLEFSWEEIVGVEGEDSG
jgi:hypothetical protein